MYHRFPGYNNLEIIERMRSHHLPILENYWFSSEHDPHVCKGSPGPYEPDSEPSTPTGIYPNPANATLTISLPGTETEETAIFNAAGQLVYFDKEKKGEHFTLDVSGLAKGLYFLRLRIAGYYVTEKVVIGPK